MTIIKKVPMPRRTRIYDVAHKTIVTGLMGLTMFSGAFLVYKVYEYFTVIKPLKEQRVKIMREEEMLAQLKAREDPRQQELLAQQKAAESS